MQVNFELIDEGTLNVECIAIFPDHLWPADERFPVEPLRQWVDQQYNHGIWIKLIRQSALATEPDLLVDMGIYGSRAVGIQELDSQGRTVRFTLSFDIAFRLCRNVLVTDMSWPAYREILERVGRSAGNGLTTLSLRRSLLRDQVQYRLPRLAFEAYEPPTAR
jgi:hypothetical protein